VSLRKETLAAGLLLALALLLGGAYAWRRDTYLLNKNVRLVCMSILRYGEFSLHRSLPYRIQFNRDSYRVLVFRRGLEQKWEEVKTVPYESSIEAATPGLTIELKNGELASYRLAEGRESLRSYLVLNFFHRHHPSRRKGVIFRESGEWRAL
jgi:hypothetical protein